MFDSLSKNITSNQSLLLRLGMGAEYRDQFVCLCVCLWSRACLWNRWIDLREISCADPL